MLMVSWMDSLAKATESTLNCCCMIWLIWLSYIFRRLSTIIAFCLSWARRDPLATAICFLMSLSCMLHSSILVWITFAR